MTTIATRIWMFWRSIMTLLALGVALLCVFRAPDLFCWHIAVVATEYGHWLVIVPIILLLTEPASGGIRWRVGAHLATIVLFLSPLLQAMTLAKTLPAQLASAFGSVADPDVSAEKPFDLGELWSFRRIPPVAAQPFTFHAWDGTVLRADYYPSQTSGAAPVVIVIHGGGWNSGDEKQLPELNSHLAREGYAVVAMAYRLSSQVPWPAPKEDVLALLDELKKRRSQWAIDPGQVILLGRSAGGQIALATAYGSGRTEIKGCIAFYSAADMNFAYQYSEENDIIHSRSLLRQALGGTPEERAAFYDDASAIGKVGRWTPPTLLLHGLRDELVWFRQSERLASALTEADCPHYLLAMPWATHGFDFNLRGPGGQLSTYAVDYFLAAVLRENAIASDSLH